MRYRVVHRTVYSYSDAVPICQNEVHVKPRRTQRQTCLSYRLTVLPPPQRVDECRDYFGNEIHFFTIDHAHRELSVEAESQVQISPAEYIDPQATALWEKVRDETRRPRLPEALDARQFVFDSPRVQASPELAEYAAGSFAAGRTWMAAILDLTWRIHHDFIYDPTATNVSTSPHAVLELRRGVCQDFAHLQIGCLRSLGLPARYVSGYLLNSPPEGQPRLVGADASHAWLSAYCPALGWVDFDPTNNLVPSLDHITVAWGRDYDDVCPIKGVFIGGGDHTMQVSVDVRAVEPAR